MYRAPSKRQQLFKRVAVYGTMTAIVLLLVTSLVLVMLGYRFNRTTSTIEQGGLVQFNSRPTNATVTVGSAKLSNRTPSKITVNPGTYTVTMAKNGYHTWSKLSDILAGQVLWLNYALLVPEKIQTEALNTYDNLADVLASPNGDRYALIEEAGTPRLTFVDITSNAPKQSVVALPESTLPKSEKVTYDLQSWGSDSDRMLVSARHGKVNDWLFVDRNQASDTVNLSSKYDLSISEAMFDPRSNNRIIVLTNSGELRMIDLKANTLSSVMATSVTYISPYINDALLLVQKTSETTQQVGYISYGSDTVRKLQEIDSREPVKVAGGTYFSDPYVAVSVGSKLDVFQVPSIPSSESDTPISMTNVYTTTLPATPDYLSVRTNGRFVLAQYGSGVLTYDIELKKHSQTSFTKPVSTELRWLDKHHFYLTNGASLEVLEFDGGNPHRITPLSTSFDTIMRDNSKFIYSIDSTKDGKYVLQRSRMILEN